MTTSLPPGFAEDFDPLGAQSDDPYRVYALARGRAPVFFAPRVNAWVLTRYDDVRAALRTPDVFASSNALRPLYPLGDAAGGILAQCYPAAGTSVSLDGADQRPYRARLEAALAGRRVAALEPDLRRRADALVDGFVADGRADLMSAFAYPLTLGTIGRVTGLDPAALPQIRDGSLAGSVLLFGNPDPDEQVRAAHGMRELQLVLLEQVQRHRTEPRDDALGAVAAELAPGAGPLDATRAAAVISAAQEFVVPGHTTSVTTIGNGLVRLLEDRSRWETLVARPELIGRAVEEIARFDTSVHGFLRVTTAPVTVAGVDLPAGAEVLLVFASANRDEALCDRPEEFDLTRAPTRHLGFAAGPHSCPGAAAGRLQIAVTLETLARRLPGLRRTGDGPVRMRRDFTMRGPVELPVTW